MTILQRSPWYDEIWKEGSLAGRRQAVEANILHILERRLGSASLTVKSALSRLSLSELEGLFDAALDAKTWAEFEAQLPPLNTQNGPSMN